MLALLPLLLASAPAFGKQGGQGRTALSYTVKPPEIAVPAGVPPGKFRRITQPFQNWTLVCDENLVQKTKVCNISQTIVGPNSSQVFSWSLAGDRSGEPFFVMRIPPYSGAGSRIQLDFRDGSQPIDIAVTGCDKIACVAYQNVDPRLRAAIEKNRTLRITYTVASLKRTISFNAPLLGLDDALSSI